MKCPKCKSRKLIVKDSRAVMDVIKRRRECTECNHRFFTYESQMYINNNISAHIRKAIRQYVRNNNISDDDYEDLIKCYKSLDGMN